MAIPGSGPDATRSGDSRRLSARAPEGREAHHAAMNLRARFRARSFPHCLLAMPPPELQVTTWVDPVVDPRGHPADSPYVEIFWLPVLGPSATFLLRRLSLYLDMFPEGLSMDLSELSCQLGLGRPESRHAALPGPSTGVCASGWHDARGPIAWPYVGYWARFRRSASIAFHRFSNRSTPTGPMNPLGGPCLRAGDALTSSGAIGATRSWLPDPGRLAPACAAPRAAVDVRDWSVQRRIQPRISLDSLWCSGPSCQRAMAHSRSESRLR